MKEMRWKCLKIGNYENVRVKCKKKRRLVKESESQEKPNTVTNTVIFINFENSKIYFTKNIINDTVSKPTRIRDKNPKYHYSCRCTLLIDLFKIFIRVICSVCGWQRCVVQYCHRGWFTTNLSSTGMLCILNEWQRVFYWYTNERRYFSKG